MLRNIKENSSGLTAKIILGLIVISFVFWGVGSSIMTIGNNDAASVNDGKITITDFNQALQTERNKMTSQFGDNIGTEYFESENFKRGVMNRLIMAELQKQEAEKFDYDVSSKQIKDYIEAAPALQIDGKFSKEAYASFLGSVNKSPEMMQREISKGLKSDALPQMLQSSAFVLDSEIKTQYKLSKQKRDFSYVEVSASDFIGKVEVSEKEIEDYYNEFSQDYMTEEQVSVNYIELSTVDLISDIEVTDDEIATQYELKKSGLTNPEKRKAAHILLSVNGNEEEVRTKIENIAKRISDGEDFATVAKEVSEDPGSAERGGDLGWVAKGDMVKPFEDKLFSMQPGEISGPVLSDFGYHLIKLEEIKEAEIPPLDEIKDTLVDEIKQEKASEDFLTKADELATFIVDSDNVLELAAENAGLNVQTTELFTRRGGLGAAANQNFIKMAFSDAVKSDDETSEMVDMGENHIAYMHINEHKVSVLKPLADVSESIKKKITEEKALDKAREETESQLKLVNSGDKTLQDLAVELGKSVVEEKEVERIGSKLPFNLVKNIFALKFDAENIKSEFVESTANSFAIVELHAVTNADVSTISEDDKTNISGQLQRSVSNSEVGSIVEELRSDATVSINEKIFNSEQ